MASNERIKKYLDAGTVFGKVTRARAEDIVRELVSAGDIQRGQAQEWVDNLVDRSKKSSEQLLELVRREVSTQLSKIDSSSLESIANQVADIIKRSAEAGRSATADATKTAKHATDAAAKTARQATDAAAKTARQATDAAAKTAKRVTPTVGKKKPAAKKAPAKKAPAKKTTAKKTTAKKTTAKKTTAAKKAPAAKKAAS
jgi:polyhydroxyalkanoate synthesis regulator phasin